MSTDIRIKADDAKRLMNDTAFKQFMADVREDQKVTFANSAADEVSVREEAHAILRALNKIEQKLNAAIAAEVMLDRKR
jgi:hypothetical protein